MQRSSIALSKISDNNQADLLPRCVLERGLDLFKVSITDCLPKWVAKKVSRQKKLQILNKTLTARGTQLVKQHLGREYEGNNWDWKSSCLFIPQMLSDLLCSPSTLYFARKCAPSLIPSFLSS